jgi:hypothetical protein
MINSLKNLINSVKSLGFNLGWRYWKLNQKALVNPWLVLEWAENCDRMAVELDEKNERLLAKQHREWAIALRSSYAEFMLSETQKTS